MAFTDNFNRANEDLEASANWTMLEGNAGGITVESNAARARATATQAAYHAPDQGSADHYVQAAWLTSPNPGGPFICARMTDGNNFVGVRYQGNASLRWELYRRVTGSLTLLGSHTAAFNSGDVIRLECEGTEARVLLNGALVLTREINAAGLTSTRTGLVSRATAVNPWIDDFETGTLGAVADELLADDISSGTPTVGSPALGQVHALSAEDAVAGVPTVGAPALSDGTVQEQPRRGGIEIKERQRRKFRYVTAAALQELIDEQQEEEPKPLPPKKRKVVAERIVKELAPSGGILVRKELTKFVTREVAKVSRPGVELVEEVAAVVRRASEEAARLQEIEDEDEIILMMVA